MMWGIEDRPDVVDVCLPSSGKRKFSHFGVCALWGVEKESRSIRNMYIYMWYKSWTGGKEKGRATDSQVQKKQKEKN